MLNLSAAAILEKNKLAADGAWLILLEINIQSLPEPIRIVRNNEDIVWNNHVWVAFPFEIGDIKEDSKGEFPSVPVKVSNITRTVQQYIEQAQGGVGALVVLRVVHSKHLDLNAPELEETFTVQNTISDNQWVTFTLGGDYPTMLRFPLRRILKDFCPFSYAGIECGVSETTTIDYPQCNKTLADCRLRGNSTRFGGEPSIPQGGIYASNR